MKKLFLINLFFLSFYNHSLCQDFLIIKNIGLRDSNIPNLLIKKGKITQAALDSNSIDYDILHPVIIDLDSKHFKIFAKTIYEGSNLLNKKLKNLLPGTFEIVRGNEKHTDTLYLSSSESRVFFRS